MTTLPHTYLKGDYKDDAAVYYKSNNGKEYQIAKAFSTDEMPAFTVAEKMTVAMNMHDDLVQKFQIALNALTLVHNSGPLNNGLSDENTMKIVAEAIKQVS